MATEIQLDQIFAVFRSDVARLAQELGDAVLRLERSTNSAETSAAADAAFRCAHGIKGAAGTLGLDNLQNIVHRLEDVLTAIRDGLLVPDGDSADLLFAVLDAIDDAGARAEPGKDAPITRGEELTARLDALLSPAAGSNADSEPLEPAAAAPARAASADVEPAPVDKGRDGLIHISPRKLDQLLSQVGELVEMKIKMEEMQRRVEEVEVDLLPVGDALVKAPRENLQQLARDIEQDVQYLGKLLGAVQSDLTVLRMVPVKTLFAVCRRAVRDVCRTRGLEVELELNGGDFELDRDIVEGIKTPIIHLLRNAVDHGIETAEKREQLGKPAAGKVSLSVGHRGGSISLTISDDGHGIDYQRVRERAEEHGWISSGEGAASTAELTRLLFLPGMSTADQADSISGRGVGLDAVKQTVEQLRGTIAIDSTPGEGTRFEILLPLTLANDTGLFVVTRGQRFVIPRHAVERVLPLGAGDLVSNNGATTLWYEGQHLPIARLEPSLAISACAMKEGEEQVAILLRAAEAMAAVVVDEFESESEIVVRSLGTFIQRMPGISGLTVTAAGEMFFVLDAASLVKAVVRPGLAGGLASISRSSQEDAPTREVTVMVVDDSVTTRMLNEKMLRAAGFNVVTAPNGASALERLRREPPDIVLSDVQMPELDGNDLTRRVKADPQLARIPVILLTALDTPDNKAKGLAAGADAYLVKQRLTQAELIETIEQLV